MFLDILEWKVDPPPHAKSHFGGDKEKKWIVSTTVLCPQLFCVPNCLVSKTVFCPELYCVHNCLVSTTVLCPQLSCVHKCLVSTSVLCPQLYCVHNCLVSQVSCVHKCLVSTTVLCLRILSGRTPGTPMSWGESDRQEGISNIWPGAGAGAVSQDTRDTSEKIYDKPYVT